jgi:hypothetical protein
VSSVKEVKSVGNAVYGEALYARAARRYGKALRYAAHARTLLADLKDRAHADHCK